MNRHTEYIRKLSDETGKTYRELETYWKIAMDTYNKLQMVDPSKYEHLRESGSESEEIKNIFEKAILKLPELREEETPVEDEVDTIAQDEFAEDIEEEIAPEESMEPEEDFSEFDIEPEPTSTKEKLEKAERESSSEDVSEVEDIEESPVDEVFDNEGESEVERNPKNRDNLS